MSSKKYTLCKNKSKADIINSYRIEKKEGNKHL